MSDFTKRCPTCGMEKSGFYFRQFRRGQGWSAATETCNKCLLYKAIKREKKLTRAMSLQYGYAERNGLLIEYAPHVELRAIACAKPSKPYAPRRSNAEVICEKRAASKAKEAAKAERQARLEANARAEDAARKAAYWSDYAEKLAMKKMLE